MSNATLTEEQWAGFGRFQRILAQKLDVEWTISLYHYDALHPSVEVQLRMPLDRHFQSLDDVVEDAFVEAKIDGYENSGFGHNPKPIGGTIHRDLDFHPVETYSVFGGAA